MLNLLAGFVVVPSTQSPAPTPPLVLIHGAGGGAWEYDFWTPVFKQAGYQTIAKDLQPVRNRYDLTQVSDYEQQVINWVPAGHQPVLIGASLGGILALSTAKQLNPRAIVLVNPVPPAGIRPPKSVSFPPIIEWENGPLQDSIDAMPDSDRTTIEWAHKLWRNESGQVLNQVSNPGISVEKPNCPILVVISQNDTDILPETSRKLAQLYGAKTLELPHTSHVGPLLGRSAPEVAKKILSWIQTQLNSKS